MGEIYTDFGHQYGCGNCNNKILITVFLYNFKKFPEEKSYCGFSKEGEGRC